MFAIDYLDNHTQWASPSIDRHPGATHQHIVTQRPPRLFPPERQDLYHDPRASSRSILALANEGAVPSLVFPNPVESIQVRQPIYESKLCQRKSKCQESNDVDS